MICNNDCINCKFPDCIRGQRTGGGRMSEDRGSKEKIVRVPEKVPGRAQEKDAGVPTAILLCAQGNNPGKEKGADTGEEGERWRKLT